MFCLTFSAFASPWKIVPNQAHAIRVLVLERSSRDKQKPTRKEKTEAMPYLVFVFLLVFVFVYVFDFVFVFVFVFALVFVLFYVFVFVVVIVFAFCLSCLLLCCASLCLFVSSFMKQRCVVVCFVLPCRLLLLPGRSFRTEHTPYASSI